MAPAERFLELDLSAVRVLLCDADDSLFPSEQPAFVAATEATNRLLRDLGSHRSYEPDELRRVAAGRNFRAMAQDLAAEHEVELEQEELERLVAEEIAEVSAYLGRVLCPDPEVIEPLTRLARRYDLAVVSSSALSRLEACFTATGLDDLFPPAVRYSAEDSLPEPTSKPDPAVYSFAREDLGIGAAEGLAIEDSVPGTTSAVAAGFQTVGNVMFVPPEEQAGRVEQLREAGAAAIMHSWRQLEELLGADVPAVSESR
jgi:beta-phosphoglucomutase-like phosphatase (HAD superfamily)